MIGDNAGENHSKRSTKHGMVMVYWLSVVVKLLYTTNQTIRREFGC
jgi:hypothetical protein